MRTDRIIGIGKILATSIVLLGVVHDIATFSPLIQGDLTCVNREALHSIIYMSLICGTSLILSGILLMFLFKRTVKFPFLSTAILIIGTFLAANGILSVMYMFNNPFAWIAFVLNLGVFIVALVLKMRLKKVTNV